MSFVERYSILGPYLGVSTIRGLLESKITSFPGTRQKSERSSPIFFWAPRNKTKSKGLESNKYYIRSWNKVLPYTCPLSLRLPNSVPNRKKAQQYGIAAYSSGRGGNRRTWSFLPIFHLILYQLSNLVPRPPMRPGNEANHPSWLYVETLYQSL